MPFIFHQKKQSIFHHQIPTRTEEQQRKIAIIQHKRNQSPKNYKINMEVCKQHPFRKNNNNKKNTNEEVQQENNQCQLNEFKIQNNSQEKQINRNNKLITQFLIKQKKQKTKKVQMRIKIQQNTNDSTLHSLEDSIKKCFPEIIINKSPKGVKEQSTQKKKTQYHKKIQKMGLFQTLKSSQQLQQIKNNQRKNEDNITYPLGPGSYDVKYPMSQKVTITYNNRKTLPLRPKKSINQLIDQMARKQKTEQKQKQSQMQFRCSYKNQSSAVFKNKSFRGQIMKKNGQLLSKIFSKKQDEEQKQTACESRHVKRSQFNLNSDQFQENRQRSPSPGSYDPSKTLLKQSHNHKNGALISGTPKPQFSFVNTDLIIADSLNQQKQTEQLFNQNQNKDNDKKNNYYQCFLSTVPRQLHFDTQNLCSQQFWYSPKNNLTDVLQSTINERSKLKFGSTIKRFQCDKIDQIDPYKYCQAKTKYLNTIASKHNNNIASLKYTQKRQLFKQIENNSNQNISSANYAPQNYTIKSYILQTVAKNELQESYQKFTNSVKNKKNFLQNALIEKQIKIKTYKQYEKKYDPIDPDRYKNYLKEQIYSQKENISFGRNKLTEIDRSIKANKTLDKYYQVESSWKINSFNKFYGLNVFEG